MNSTSLLYDASNTAKDDSDIDDIEFDSLDELLMNQNGKRTSSSVTTSSNPGRKRSRTSVYENIAQIAANGMSSLGASIVEAQQLLVTSLESKFMRCLKILNEMKMEGCISNRDYFRICDKFMEHENYSEMFLGMTADLRLEWLMIQDLLNK